jgi:hypothetical protein
MKAYVQLGKGGDILSLLPVLHDEFVRTGEKPVLVTSEQYASITDRLDYLYPIVLPLDWQDLTGAVKEAKRRFETVIVTQTFGVQFPIEHRTPSFQLDQWLRAGALEKWDLLALHIPRLVVPTSVGMDRPCRKSEAQSRSFPHHRGDDNTILYADHSQSSPFPHREDLAETLAKEFPGHRVVRLSEIKMPHPLDLLNLYDDARLIVTVETMHLHLSAATQTPVIALATDAPSLWNGSAWSKRFALHCRYKDYPQRKAEIVAAAKRALERQAAIEPRILPTRVPHAFAYNMSLLDTPHSILSTYRYHPQKNWKTRLAIDDGGYRQDIKFLPEADFSMEDGRLFMYQGHPWLAYVTSTAQAGQFRSVIRYGELLRGPKGEYTIAKQFQPNYGHNNWRGMEKNWVPIVHDGRLFFIYGATDSIQTVIEVRENTVIAEHKTDVPTWDFGPIRGGCVLEHEGKLLRFFHSRVGSPHQYYDFRYYMGVALMESKPPFNTLTVNLVPILAGNEQYTPGCFHWKPNVTIPYGAIHSAGKIQVSIGLNDCKCAVVDLTPEQLNL